MRSSSARALSLFAVLRTPLVPFALAALSPLAHAQSVLGSIAGTVQDSAGAAVANATIVLHRVDPNTDRC